MTSAAFIAGTCFSIEPGIYLPEFGIRSEVNVYVGEGFRHRHRRATGANATPLSGGEPLFSCTECAQNFYQISALRRA